jgi:hypothetical protein
MDEWPAVSTNSSQGTAVLNPFDSQEQAELKALADWARSSQLSFRIPSTGEDPKPE